MSREVAGQAEEEPGPGLDDRARLLALVEPTRIRILATLLEGPATAAGIAERLGVALTDVVHHVRVLGDAGLLRPADEGDPPTYLARAEVLSQIARHLANDGTGAPDSADETTADRHLEYRDRVLRAFLKNGRLVAIPSQEKKKLVVLNFLLDECFAEDREYTETEVNERLRAYHEDVASLRRFMVVSGLLNRAAGSYRRAESAETPETR